MKPLALFIIFLVCSMANAMEFTQGGIPLDAQWKQKVYEYAKANVKHSIWGLSHSERDYHVAVGLAEKEGLDVDKDVLFASAFLHDIGAIDPFRVKGVEHATRSVQIVEPLLKIYGLPEAKISKIRETILAHMYYSDVIPKGPEAVVFHDADTLDFLGDIGIVRIVGLTDRHAWAPNLVGGIETLRGWTKELPTKLITKSAKTEATKRIKEMTEFLEALKMYTVGNSNI